MITLKKTFLTFPRLHILAYALETAYFNIPMYLAGMKNLVKKVVKVN